MNVAPHDLRPRKPARYNQPEFERLIRLLPDAALRRLEVAVSDLQREVNLIAVTKALLAHSLSQANEALPAIPPDLLPFADPEISGGREYGLLLNVDPCDQAATVRSREQFIREAQRVHDLMQSGMGATEAWRRAARRSVLDESMPNLPDRKSVRRRRVKIEEDERPRRRRRT